MDGSDVAFVLFFVALVVAAVAWVSRTSAAEPTAPRLSLAPSPSPSPAPTPHVVDAA